jgi:hypothetical protein
VSQERENESTEGIQSVDDDQLPEELRPTDDNPLAQPADDDVPDDIVGNPDDGGSDSDSEGATPGGGVDADASTREASSEGSAPDQD